MPPAASAVLAGLPADAPLALFGHGLGALWAFELARRLEGLYQRPLLHLFVCAAAAPNCFLPPSRSAGAGGGEGGGGTGARSGPLKRCVRAHIGLLGWLPACLLACLGWGVEEGGSGRATDSGHVMQARSNRPVVLLAFGEWRCRICGR